MPVCWVCQKEVPVVQSHHVNPVAYGGIVNSPLVDICANHHQAIHTFALGLTSKNPKRRVDLFTPECLERGEYLATEIARAKLKKQHQETLMTRVTFEMPTIIYNLARARQKDTGMDNFNLYLLSLIAKDIKKI